MAETTEANKRRRVALRVAMCESASPPPMIRCLVEAGPHSVLQEVFKGIPAPLHYAFVDADGNDNKDDGMRAAGGDGMDVVRRLVEAWPGSVMERTPNGTAASPPRLPFGSGKVCEAHREA